MKTEKLNETCFLLNDNYAVVKPETRDTWVVLNKAAEVLFMSKHYDECVTYVEKI